MGDKDAAALELIQWHFDVEPSITRILRFCGDNEDSPREPIKLLEVNEDTFETGKVEPFVFPPYQDIGYPTAIATVSGSEFAGIREGKIGMPEGWDLSRAKEFEREEAPHDSR